MMMRISKRDLLARTLDLSGCGRMLRATSSWHGVLILNYHRIGNRHTSLLDRNLWSATTEDFEAQMRTIRENFQVIGLDDLDAALHKPRGRHVMITFDDGYQDNYINAFPILKKYEIPATFFITTGFVDARFVPWWDEIAWMVRTSPLDALDVNCWTTTPVPFDQPHREIAINRLLSIYKSMPGAVTTDFLSFLSTELQTGRCPLQIAEELWMTWEMIREMRQHGMFIGGHTVTHPILANIPAEQQDQQISICRRRLSEEVGEPIDAFSYPVGGARSFNAHTRESLARHGFKWGFTFIRGYSRDKNQDRFTIPRTAIETDIDLAHFRAITTLPQVFA